MGSEMCIRDRVRRKNKIPGGYIKNEIARRLYIHNVYWGWRDTLYKSGNCGFAVACRAARFSRNPCSFSNSWNYCKTRFLTFIFRHRIADRISRVRRKNKIPGGYIKNEIARPLYIHSVYWGWRDTLDTSGNCGFAGTCRAARFSRNPCNLSNSWNYCKTNFSMQILNFLEVL